ncbi:SDR family NAD(P)-dependent oxidoreductase, partial [Candidatus Saccharibacteria bacterium]|nr:SDR family NAD(P)-dependent oxidoreductase [Candidatus Saccharibacteria bacterium]
MNVVIIGGSSGLGLELAKKFAVQGDSVIITGRTDLKEESVKFIPLNLSEPELPKRIEAFVQDLPQVDLLVYAAGYYQEGRVTDLS